MLKIFGRASVFFCVVLLWGCTSPGPKPSSTAAVSSLTESQSARYQQALTSLEQKQPQQAEALLNVLVRERGDIGELWLNRAFSQYHQQKFELADKTAQKILQDFTGIAAAHNLAGLLAVERGDFKAGQNHYLAALNLRPDYANVLFNMALLQDVYLQDIKSALDYYGRYLLLVTDDEATKSWVEYLSQAQSP